VGPTHPPWDGGGGGVPCRMRPMELAAKAQGIGQGPPLRHHLVWLAIGRGHIATARRLIVHDAWALTAGDRPARLSTMWWGCTLFDGTSECAKHLVSVLGGRAWHTSLKAWPFVQRTKRPLSWPPQSDCPRTLTTDPRHQASVVWSGQRQRPRQWHADFSPEVANIPTTVVTLAPKGSARWAAQFSSGPTPVYQAWIA
jgi:hypothetical protein